MGRVAAWTARTALGDGWDVTLVAAFVEQELESACVVRRAPAVRALPAVPQHLAWLAAARRALRGVDGAVVHVHAPGLIGHADVMTCHHLAAAAREFGVREPGSGAVAAARRVQATWQRALDDRWYGGRRSQTRMTFVSDFLRDEFARRYGAPFDGTVLPPAAPAWRPVTSAQRSSARQRWGVDGAHIVVGYLGGNDVRKGVADIERLAGDEGIRLLVAGPGSERLRWPGVAGLGFVQPDAVIEACDVVVAPALFDAAPVAVIEPIARGVPVVVRSANGWATRIERHRAGAVWDPASGASLSEAIGRALGASGCEAMVDEISGQRLRGNLLSLYGRVTEMHPRRAPATGRSRPR